MKNMHTITRKPIQRKTQTTAAGAAQRRALIQKATAVPIKAQTQRVQEAAIKAQARKAIAAIKAAATRAAATRAAAVQRKNLIMMTATTIMKISITTTKKTSTDWMRQRITMMSIMRIIKTS